jgi:enoyl-CoA hydratase/carnithine racemase
VDSDKAETVVLVETRGQVQWILINRPERRNALNEAVAAGIANGLREAQGDPAIRAVVLTGVGDKAFCAGGDMQPAADGSPFEADPARPENPVIELFRAFERCGLPTIARVNGHALAGGLGLVCACDLAIASESATLGVPESSVGLFPMMILPYLQRTLPRRKLLEWCITGVRWSAQEALEVDLLNYTAPDGELDTKLDWLLGRIVDKSPTAIRLGKLGLRAVQDMTIPQAFEYTQLMLPNMAKTRDAKEGFAAFREKRSPEWTGE